MTVVPGERHGGGEDSIFFDDAKGRYVGVVSLGYSASGTRVRKNVMGPTKTEVRDKALREELGTVKLTSLTAGAGQKALANLAAGRSTRTVQMAHNVLVRAIRHAERDDLVGGTWRRWSSRRRGSWAGGRRSR